MKEESEKVGLKLNIQKMKIMASGPITSWQIDGETVKTVSDFILGGSKITANGDCSHEITELFVRQRERPGLHSQAVAWPHRLSAGRRESGSQRPYLGEAQSIGASAPVLLMNIQG